MISVDIFFFLKLFFMFFSFDTEQKLLTMQEWYVVMKWSQEYD